MGALPNVRRPPGLPPALLQPRPRGGRLQPTGRNTPHRPHHARRVHPPACDTIITPQPYAALLWLYNLIVCQTDATSSSAGVEPLVCRHGQKSGTSVQHRFGTPKGPWLAAKDARKVPRTKAVSQALNTPFDD
eukprot:6063896-Pyramimonas_sp.AAC.1